MKITEIVWDLDGEEVELPTEVSIPSMEEDEIADYLSDCYGFCIFSFNISE